MKTESYDAFLQKQLRDPELAAEYLTAAIEEDSPALFLIALRHVAEAHGGIGAVADAAKNESSGCWRQHACVAGSQIPATRKAALTMARASSCTCLRWSAPLKLSA